MKKKLIEVALPLEAINDASAYDKLPGIGPHPKGLHKWWAPLPLPCARAILFASLIDDPSENPSRFPTEDDQKVERDRLFDLIRALVGRRAERDERIFQHARDELRQQFGTELIAVLDPFSGSGAIPLEAQRLGLSSLGRDINPVATLMTKAVIELPARFADFGPVHPERGARLTVDAHQHTAKGLAADVRAYGRSMLSRAQEKLGTLYPTIAIDGQERTVVAWIWCRTAACPNPACGAEMPLVSSYVLSNIRNRRVCLLPHVNRSTRTVGFSIESELEPPPPPKVGRGGSFRCAVCDEIAPESAVMAEGSAGRIGSRLLAIVASGPGGKGRVYLPVDSEHESLALSVQAADPPNVPLAENPRNISGKPYGFRDVADLFTSRQLHALTTLTGLVRETRTEIRADAIAAGIPDDGVRLVDGGKGATAYADGVATYLGMAVDRAADFNNAFCRWVPGNEKVMNLFSRQAIPLVWDYAEANILADVVGGFGPCSDYVAECLETIIVGSALPGDAQQADARTNETLPAQLVVSTDPPYYDNIAYSDLSDVFYVWLRRSLADIYPELLSTLLTPKQDELIASPYRFGGNKQAAREHFETGFLATLTRLRPRLRLDIPLTLYYAFKQAEAKVDGGSASVDLTTGWETMLTALVAAGFQVTATWPVRASQNWRAVAMGTNALASYVVFSCRPRPSDSPLATRREFGAALRQELPDALRNLQVGGVAPVDLAQASIGPGMAIFSRYARIVESDGSSMSVRAALALINAALDESLAQQDSDFDADTRFAVSWFEQHGMGDAPFGDADVLARAKNTAVGGLQEAGIVDARAGRVRLLAGADLPSDWDPSADRRLTIWEITHQLINRLENAGEGDAAELLRRVGGLGEGARELGYRLHSIAERRGWPKEALSYNSLVIAWPELVRLGRADSGTQQRQLEL